jgi:hypothetical protein
VPKALEGRFAWGHFGAMPSMRLRYILWLILLQFLANQSQIQTKNIKKTNSSG